MKPIFNFSVALFILNFFIIGCGQQKGEEKESQINPALPYTPKIAGPVEPTKSQVDQIKTQYLQRKAFQLISEGDFVSISTIKDLQFDMTAPLRCQDFLNNEAFQKVSEELGGIKWGSQYTKIANQGLPHFYYSKPIDQDENKGESVTYSKSSMGEMESAQPVADSAVANETMERAAPSAPGNKSAGPTVSRADLIGRAGDYIIFLSARLGLFFVKFTEKDGQFIPTVSCTVFVPGDPLNFYVLGDSLILLVNPGNGSNNAAILRYKINEKSLSYQGGHILANRYIDDSRLFNHSLAVLNKYVVPPIVAKTNDETVEIAASSGIAMSPPMFDGRYFPFTTKQRNHLSVLDLAENVKFKFEETFNSENRYPASKDSWNDSDIGLVHNRSTYFNRFLSASDQYLVLSKNTTIERVSGIKAYTGTFSQCEKYEDIQEVYQSCYPVWKEEINENYQAGLDCTLEDDVETCFSAAIGKVEKSVWVKTGEKCEEQTYTYKQCTAYQEKTFTNSYPEFKREAYTEFVVYKFDDETFIRLTSPQIKETDEADTLNVSGEIKEHKSLYFKDGYFYAVSTSGQRWADTDEEQRKTKLTTFKVVGNAFVKTHVIDNIGMTEEVRAILFDKSRLYLVTFRQTDPLYVIDLTIPHSPKIVSELKVPGYSTQLISLDQFLLGIGKINPDNAMDTWTSHTKLSLYQIPEDGKNASELNTEVLGKSYRQSQNETDSGQNDADQVFHFDGTNQRLFLAYTGSPKYDDKKTLAGGLKCWDYYNPKFHLSISKIENSGVNVEAELATSQNVERSLTFNETNVLSFGNSAVFHSVKNGDQWELNTVKEYWITEGIYQDESIGELVVAKQVKKAGYRATALRFVIGTEAQMKKGAHIDQLDLPAELVNCFYEPTEITFWDDKLLIVYQQKDWENDKEVTYTKRFAYRLTKEGFKKLDDIRAKEIDNYLYTICYYEFGDPQPITEAVKKDIIKGLNVEAIKCENRKSIPGEYYPGYRGHGLPEPMYSESSASTEAMTVDLMRAPDNQPSP